jgi:hypothetical protein
MISMYSEIRVTLIARSEILLSKASFVCPGLLGSFKLKRYPVG